VTDMTFILFIALAIYSFIKAYLGHTPVAIGGDGVPSLGHIKGEFRYLYMYVFMALAVLTKGPLGFFYPAFTIVAFIAMRRDWAAVKEMRIVLGLIIFTAISLPWFIAMIMLHGNEYLNNVWSLEIIKKLNVSRTGGHENAFIHYFSSVFYYLGMIFLRHLPWSVFLPAAIFSLPRRAVLYRDREKCGLHLISAWFFVVFIIIAAIWSRESYYILPLSVPLAMFIGCYLTDLTEENNLCRSALFYVPFILAIAACIIVFAAWTCIGFYVFDKPVFSLSLLMWLFPAAMLAAYILLQVTPAARGGGGAPFLGRKILLPLSMCITAIACFGYFAGGVLPLLNNEPLAHFADDIRQVIKEGDLIATESESVSYHRLNVYLDAYSVTGIRKEALNEFLSNKDKRVFCLVSAKHYDEFVAENLKKRLYILDKALDWKRLDKQNRKYFENIGSALLQNRRQTVKDALREEIYLISNREE
ncbi:MAG: hypothetical protein Q8R48_02665, partial [Candidatus Omnitrophota bacterium]|nr:hypothetical protein [Candidatus Omnitrophota bacterium]